MTKLNQVLSIEKNIKTESQQKITVAHKQSQVPALYEGRTRTYKPLDDAGEKFPPENQKIQLKSGDAIKNLQEALGELLNVTFVKDRANMSACADITVDGKIIKAAVPVTYLLFLEKQLTDINTYLEKMPVLDASENWTYDVGQSCFKSDQVETTKTKKITKPVVLYPATEQHPAQVKEVSEDIVVGSWFTTRTSSALTQDRKSDILDRVKKLQRAVKFAREQANSIEAPKEEFSSLMFAYILGE